MRKVQTMSTAGTYLSTSVAAPLYNFFRPSTHVATTTLLGAPLHMLPLNLRRALSSQSPSSASSSSQSSYMEKREQKAGELSGLAEVRAVAAFASQLRHGQCEDPHRSTGGMRLLDVASESEVRAALRAAFATFCLHAEARVAAALGEGYYTIGPCGEELLAAVGLVLDPKDPVALHYRHLATQVARHARGLDFDARGGQSLSCEGMYSLLLDRARGYVLSLHDPVTGGAHCALGGGPRDYLVTSTLASQSSPAVGRALAPGLLRHLQHEQMSVGEPRIERRGHAGGIVSYVSLGDGSVNNGHFLSAANLAAYASHKGVKCPVLFAISDNDLCISLKGVPGWLHDFTARLGFPLFTCDGTSLADIFRASRDAADATRRSGRPAVLIFRNLPRRFGHAATDRQSAYMTADEVLRLERSNPVEAACAAAVAEGIVDYPSLAGLFDQLADMTTEAFAAAAAEPKLESLGLRNLMGRNVAPLAPASANTTATGTIISSSLPSTTSFLDCTEEKQQKQQGRREVMRKHMCRAIGESLEKYQNMVYVGEDVEHGGYYLVTDGLSARFPGRVMDFPPDETSLLGASQGLAQSGMLVVCEIPYAKYLDCGMDMFAEIVVDGWLNRGNNSSEQKATTSGGGGIIIRLQGFDRGVFGGNFHTHNALPLLPGLDVVVHSNGADWVKGWRYAVRQAAAGRVVMVVDSTDLLNRRHIDSTVRDGAMLVPYPPPDEETAFDVVLQHNVAIGGTEDGSCPDDLTIVTYGNGVVAARQTQQLLFQRTGTRIGVLEVPCVSQVPVDLLARAIASNSPSQPQPILFADPCKVQQAPLHYFASELQDAGVVGVAAQRDWSVVAAAHTYNPLGSTVTFLNEADITRAALRLIEGRGT